MNLSLMLLAIIGSWFILLGTWMYWHNTRSVRRVVKSWEREHKVVPFRRMR